MFSYIAVYKDSTFSYIVVYKDSMFSYIAVYKDSVATANLTTTFGTICSFSPPVRDEERYQRYYAL